MGGNNSKTKIPNSKRNSSKELMNSIEHLKINQKDQEITKDLDFKTEDDIKNGSPAPETYHLQLKAQAECYEVKYSETKEAFLGVVKISAPIFEKRDRVSMDCVCVLDTSGSMDGDRISLVRKSVRRLVRGVQSKDRVAIVEFNSQIRVLLPLTVMDADGKDKAMIIIKNMVAFGGTNLSGGLLKGLELVSKRVERRQVCSILLFTDGEANQGIQDVPGILRVAEDAMGIPKIEKTIPVGDPARWTAKEVLQWLTSIEMNFPDLVTKFQELKIDGQILMHDITEDTLGEDLEMRRIHWPKFLREVEKLREGELDGNMVPAGSPISCTIHAFGYGTSHNSELLIKLSKRFDGMYYYIEDGDAVREGFATCLGGLMSTVGTNLKLSMTPLNCKSLTILSDVSTPSKKKETIIVNLGDIQSEEERHIMFKYDLPEAKKNAGSVAYVDVKLTYMNTITKRPDILATQLVVDRKMKTAKRDVFLDAQYNRVITTKALKKADILGEAGNLKGARWLLQRTIDEVQRSISGNNSISKTLIADLESTIKGYKSVPVFENTGQHMARQVLVCHQMERCANVNAQPQYANNNMYDVFEDFDRSCSMDSCFSAPSDSFHEDLYRSYVPERIPARTFYTREVSPPLSLGSLQLTPPRSMSNPVEFINPDKREDSPFPIP